MNRRFAQSACRLRIALGTMVPIVINAQQHKPAAYRGTENKPAPLSALYKKTMNVRIRVKGYTKAFMQFLPFAGDNIKDDITSERHLSLLTYISSYFIIFFHCSTFQKMVQVLFCPLFLKSHLFLPFLSSVSPFAIPMPLCTSIFAASCSEKTNSRSTVLLSFINSCT